MCFAGGSFPEKAHKLNRLGYIREAVLERDSAPVEAAYFGFMTSSPEESLEDGQRALQQQSASGVSYVAVDGCCTDGRLRTSKVRVTVADHYTWSDWRGLLEVLRSSFDSNQPVMEKCAPRPENAHTFLHTMACAIRDPERHFESGYVYNGKQFRLRIDKCRDERAAHAFAAKRLTSQPETVALYRGVIRSEYTGKLTKFRLWVEETGEPVLPIRIELQPRSYLSLAFEFDPALPDATRERQDI